MRVKSLFSLAAAFVMLGATVASAQQQQSGGSTVQTASVGASMGTVADGGGISRYKLGPGDKIDLRVYNDPTITGQYTVDDDGNVDIPLVGTVPAKCRTDLEIKQDIVTGLRKYLKSPSVSLMIAERNSRPLATVFGAVRDPTRVQMNRRVRLIEVLAVAGGATEQAGGDIQIFHTQPLMCPGPEDLAEMQEDERSKDPTTPSFNIYRMEDVRLGRVEANPLIRPGDIIIVHEAPPIFVTGAVRQPSNLYLKNDMSLTRAIAQVGGVVKGAKSDKIRIYRKKQGQLKPEVIIINYDAIRKQKAEDVALQAYDIIEVGEGSPWSWKNLPSTLAGFGLTGVGTMVGNAPVRIIQ